MMPGNDNFFKGGSFSSLSPTASSPSSPSQSPTHLVDRMARRVVSGMVSSGAWDVPSCTAGCDCSPFIQGVNASKGESKKMARRGAAGSAVLLKNEEGVLPIAETARVG